MFNVSDYFKKFSRLEKTSLQAREAISSAISEVCGMTGGSFELKKDVLYIKGSPVMRSIAYTKKAAIIAAIKAKDPSLRISDIR